MKERLPTLILWLGIVVASYKLVAAFALPFDRRAPRRNFELLVHKKKPKPADVYHERHLDEVLAAWQLTGPIDVALPPMYRDTSFGNAGFLSSFINHGEAILYNGPYPHPKLAIREKQTSGSGIGQYSFDNRASNAALLTRQGSALWPVGFTSFYDLVTELHYVDVETPRLVDRYGNRIEPTSVRAVHPLNKVVVYGDTTRIDMQHWSPIVWSFPQEGRLLKNDRGFWYDEVADGAEVAWLPPLPEPGERPFALFLLSPRVAPADTSAPRWWSLDEQFRRAVLENAPIAERRALLRQLEAAHPKHPLLDHYRVVAEFGGDRFDAVWQRAQREQCQLSTWYLVAWTHLPLRAVRDLPCLKEISAGRLDMTGEYVASYTVLALRDERDNAWLQDLAARVIDRSYLANEFRGFNQPLSDFAWLWLKARP